MIPEFKMTHHYLTLMFITIISVHRGFDDFLKELKTYRADMESTTTTPRSSTIEKPAKIERSKTEYKTEFKPASRCKYTTRDFVDFYRFLHLPHIAL